jgi:hypothetical protein
MRTPEFSILKTERMTSTKASFNTVTKIKTTEKTPNRATTAVLVTFTLFKNQNIQPSWPQYFIKLSNSPYNSSQEKCQNDCRKNLECKLFGYLTYNYLCYVFAYTNGIKFVSIEQFQLKIMEPYNGINYGYKTSFILFNNYNFTSAWSKYFSQFSDSPYRTSQEKCLANCNDKTECKIFGYVTNLSLCYLFNYAYNVDFVSIEKFQSKIIKPFNHINYGYKN